MLAIVGILIVIGAVLGGFLMEKGPLLVLMQPAELLIIGGAAVGTMLIANPPRILKAIAGGLKGVLGKSPFGKDNYLTTMKMLYELLNKARRLGMLGIEADIENPAESQLFQAYPNFLKHHHHRDFVCDTMRMAISGNVDAFDMDQMMERDIEVHHHGIARWPSGGDRPQGGGCAGGHVSRHPDVLRIRRAARLQHEQNCR